MRVTIPFKSEIAGLVEAKDVEAADLWPNPWDHIDLKESAKKMSLKAFKSLVSHGAWLNKQEIELLGACVPHFFGESYKVSCLAGICIHYKERFSYDENNVLGTLQRTTDGVEKVWCIQGVEVVDGKRILSTEEVAALLCGGFSSIDYDWLVAAPMN